MSDGTFALAEMLLSLGLPIGFCIWELFKLRRFRDTDTIGAERSSDDKPT